MNGGEDLTTYINIVNIYSSRYNDVKKLWTYETYIEHRKDPWGKHELQVLWDTLETLREPMKTLNEGGRITIAVYYK